MATLVEGMTRSKTEYGTTIHHYRGVRIWKFSRGYEYSIEYVQAETGRVFTRDRYAAYQLKDVPSDIDTILNANFYYADERGIVRLTDARKKEIRLAAIERTEIEITEIRNQVANFLVAGNYQAVEQGARSLIKLQTQLVSIKNELEAKGN